MNVFFFFKQETAYEMRISDWSSDVCSSDLIMSTKTEQMSEFQKGLVSGGQWQTCLNCENWVKVDEVGFCKKWETIPPTEVIVIGCSDWVFDKIGRASCRERVCKYV